MLVKYLITDRGEVDLDARNVETGVKIHIPRYAIWRVVDDVAVKVFDTADDLGELLRMYGENIQVIRLSESVSNSQIEIVRGNMEDNVAQAIDQLVEEEDDYANRFIHQYKQACAKIVELLKAAGYEDAHTIGDNKILASDVEYYMDPYEGEGVVEVDDEDGKTVVKFRPNMEASIERAASAIIAHLEEWLEAGGADEGVSEYAPGDPIDVEVGDKVDAGAYGKLWITGTGVVGDLWTSEDQDDIDTQRGRGLKYGYVDAVQKQGRGPWIKVKFDKDNEAYEVVG